MAIKRLDLRLYEIVRNASLIIVICLAFLVPFDSSRNIDLQGILLIVAGVLAWFAIALKYKYFVSILDSKIMLLLGILITSIIVSAFVNPNVGSNLIGAPLIRLGSLGLIACIGVGILSLDIQPKQLINWLYGIISLIAITAVPYYIFVFESVERIGGVFAQPDILAVILGCGVLLGFDVIKKYPDKLQYLGLVQIYMFILLLMTQTRVGLLLTLILSCVWIWQTQTNLKKRQIYIIFGAFIILVFSLISFLPSRITDTEYAKTSVTYRINLQQSAIQQTYKKPITGYGIGNIADALDCRKLGDQSLQNSCNDGYYFDSSHNIYLDRVLGFGWISGIAYLFLVLLTLWRGFHKTTDIRIFAYCGLLIALYYLTNVTSLTLELLLWVLLLQCLVHPSKPSRV